ncbi:1-acylglycerol-3-phosphate O-acyltransferase 6 (lysophosphatidic acid acyltransferase, zeta) [Actinomortierella ambigua]|nr:1-acylglycerol-3-phosphate O-acyltransferase 6 (lysophosphatidic acid acyltransferase, zeta) [Actinomortierella ambigua]
MNREKTLPRRTLHEPQSSESSSDTLISGQKDADLLKFARCFTRLPRDPVSRKWRRPLYVTGALYRYTILFLLRSTIFTASTIAFFSIIPLFISLSANKAGRTLCKLYCKALMLSFGIRLTNHGTKPDLHDTPHVFVANHTSFLDYIVMAGHKFPHAVIMARHKGLIGWLQKGVLAFLNSTAFDREDSQQRQAVKNKLKEQLEKQPDCKLLLFPESTCVNNQYVVRFQKGVFDLDNDRVQICPVAIRYGPQTDRSTVFEDSDQNAAMRRHHHRRSRQQQQQKQTRNGYKRRHCATSEDEHGWQKDLMHVSSAETTEGEDNDHDEAVHNGWRKDLFRISDDEEEEEEDEACHSGGIRAAFNIQGNADVCESRHRDHDWNAVDPYWDTRQSLWQQLFYLMTRWKLETHVHYLPPQTRRRRRKHQRPHEQEGDGEATLEDGDDEEEDPVDFANRIRLDIARTAQLKVAEFNGRDKKQLLKLMDQQEKQRGRYPSKESDLVETSSSVNMKRSSSPRSMDEGYGSSLGLNSLAMTSA